MIKEPSGARPQPSGALPGLRRRCAEALRGFRTWRGERPFWAGLFTLAAGVPIIYFAYVNLSLAGIPLALSTSAGAGSLIIGVLLIVLGLTLWFHQEVRVFAGAAALLLALVSFPVANLGGLLLGLLSGLIGGSLACAWTPPSTAARPQPTARPGTP
ncbi:DUF6114 domain-containing protein [Streptomyces sp. NPDC091376]|uniref:DUF6114 domain-containing protein n=1 Tax=Streptomyces sp. NPDC091376 TaxID=3365994 RepID=UPI0037F8CCB9